MCSVQTISHVQKKGVFLAIRTSTPYTTALQAQNLHRYAVKLQRKKPTEVALGAKTTLSVFLIENLNLTQALSALSASCRNGSLSLSLSLSLSRETSLNPRALRPPISIMTSYTVQKVARDMLLILTTRSFIGNAWNVETSRSIKTIHEAKLGISRIHTISWMNGEARTRER